MNKERFTSIYVEGVNHNLGTVIYDDETGRVAYMVGSFYTKQLFDNFVSVKEFAYRNKNLCMLK